jgi:hypothetical protein
MKIIRAAFLYWLLAFAAGFVLGALRVMLVEPMLAKWLEGFAPLVAVAIEAPIMLTVSWVAAAWVLGRRPAWTPVETLGMGGLAWLLLQLAELGLALVMGLSTAAYFEKLTTLAGVLGVVIQLLFAFVPLLVLWRSEALADN